MPERVLPYDINIEDLLTELLEYMEDRQDADHDGENFVPNKEMRLAVDIQQALYQIENVKAKNHMAELALQRKPKSVTPEDSEGDGYQPFDFNHPSYPH